VTGRIASSSRRKWRGRSTEVLPGMMSAEDVAEVVVFTLERPRHLRLLELAMRPITESSWG
jgi:3-oxoacyl-[acyl-carrier protein] reductase